jgi:hypothetical protein
LQTESSKTNKQNFAGLENWSNYMGKKDFAEMPSPPCGGKVATDTGQNCVHLAFGAIN